MKCLNSVLVKKTIMCYVYINCCELESETKLLELQKVKRHINPPFDPFHASSNFHHSFGIPQDQDTDSTKLQSITDRHFKFECARWISISMYFIRSFTCNLCKVQPWHQHQYFWVTYNMEKITEQVNHWNRPHYTTLNLGSFICWNFCFASFLPVVWIDILVFIFHLMAGSSPTSTSFGYKSFFINL